MAKKQKWLVATIGLLVSVLCCLALVACNGTGSGKNTGNNGGKKETDPFYTEGFTKETLKGDAAKKEVVVDFLTGLYNVAMPIATDVKEKAGFRFVGDADLNGVPFNLAFALNYAANTKAGNAFLIELSEKESADVVHSCYFVNQESDPSIYLKLGANKMKIPYIGEAKNPFVPLPIDKKTPEKLREDIEHIATRLTAIGDIKYEYKKDAQNNTYERHAYINLNLKDSLKGIIDASDYFANGYPNLDYLCQDFFGVTADDIRKGKFPPSRLQIEFTTKLGAEEVGAGKLNTVKMDLNVDESGEHLNTIFKGDKYDATFMLSDFVSSGTNSNTIVVPSPTDYVAYSTKKYRVDTKISYPDAPNATYALTMQAEYNEQDPNQSLVSIAVTVPSTGREQVSLYYKNNRIYLNVLEGGVEKNVSFNIDFAKFMGDVEALWVADGDDGTSLAARSLSYVVSAFLLQDTALKNLQYTYNVNSLSRLLNLTPEEFRTTLENASTDDVKGQFSAANLDFIKFVSRAFVLQVDTSKAFIQEITTLTLPQDLAKLK